MEAVLVLLAVAGAWMFVNIKSSMNWLNWLSLTGMIIFMVMASAAALDVAGVPVPGL